MKLKIICLVLVLLSLFSINCFAATPAENNMELSFGEDYVVITQDNVSKYTEIIEKMGYSRKSFQKLFVEGDLVAFILHSKSKSQIQIKVNETKFSKQTESLSFIKEENIAQVAEKISPDYSQILRYDGTYYIFTDEKIDDESGKYSSSQFSTIKNGRLYTISIYNNNPSDEFNENILKKIYIEEQVKRSDFTYVAYFVFFLLLILALLALITYIVISIINTIREKEDNDVREFVKIKRRKF